MSDEELVEALLERSVFHEFASEVLACVGDKSNSESARRIADLYEKMAMLVCHVENVSFED